MKFRSKLRYGTLQNANNKGADQTAQAGLSLRCSQTPEDRFSRIKAHLSMCLLIIFRS